MARIRTIKPEFWADEKLSECDPITRLVFLGLIGMADDCGRLLDNTKIIDAFVFPSTSDTCREAVANLSRMCRVRRGITASGQKVIQIVNWARHQKVDKPNLLSALPEIVEEIGVAAIRDEFANDSRQIRDGASTRPTTYDLRPTNNDQRPTTVDRGPNSCSPEVERLKNGRTKKTYTEQFAEWYAAYPRRQSKGDASRAYPKAIAIICKERSIGEAEAVPWLLEVTRKFAESRKGQDQKFTPLPATWLNAQGFYDEPLEKPSRVPTAEDLVNWNPVDGGLRP